MPRACFWLWKTNTYLANPTPLEWMVTPSTTTIESKGFWLNWVSTKRKFCACKFFFEGGGRRRKKKKREEVVILLDKSFTTQPKGFPTIPGFAWWEVEYTKTKEHQSWIILQRFLILVEGKARQAWVVFPCKFPKRPSFSTCAPITFSNLCVHHVPITLYPNLGQGVEVKSWV